MNTRMDIKSIFQKLWGPKMEAVIIRDSRIIKAKGFLQIVDALKPGVVEELNLSKCKLTHNIVLNLSSHLHDKAIKVKELDISNNKDMEPAAYEKVVEIMETAKVDKLRMNNCDLRKEKLQVFQRSLKDKKFKMEWIALNENKTIEPKGFQHIVEIFCDADIQVLGLCNCHLTSEKLSAFNQYLQGKVVKIAQLELVENKSMEPAAYKEVAKIVSAATVDKLCLDRCDLNKEKLRSFQESLGKNTKMKWLVLDENKTIEPEGFRHIAEIFRKADIQTLALRNCNLTSEKLSAFHQYLYGKAVKITHLTLSNNKDMGPAAYHELAKIMEAAKVDRLWLKHCELDDEKLCSFRSGLSDLQIKMRLLSLDGNRSIECKDFEYIVSILEVATINRLSLSDCDLTLEKLQAFSFYLTWRNAKVLELDITKNRRIDPSCKEVQEIIKKAKINTLLSDKVEKQNQSQQTVSKSTLSEAKETDSGIQESAPSCSDVLSNSVLRIKEDRDTADSGIEGSVRWSEDVMSVRTKEKVTNWLLEKHPGTEAMCLEEESIVAKVLELGAKCHLRHSTELESLLRSLKDGELSCESLINIFMERNDGSDTKAAFILAECVTKLLGAELETQQSLSEQTFAFINRALNGIDDTMHTQLTINCTNEICKNHFALSKYSEAVNFCERGIGLLKGAEGADNIRLGDLQQNAGFAYTFLHDLSTARSYYLQASESYDKAGAHDAAEAQKRKQLLKGRLEDLDRWMCTQLPVLQSHGIQARVGSSGAVMTTEDCVIDFPQEAITSDTNIYIYLDDNAAHLPRGVIPITPVMRITPCMTLQNNATVKLRTWCTSSSGGKANIYFRKMEESEWKSIDEVALGEQQYFEFKISEFCTYCVATDGDQMDGKELAVQSCLFYNASGKLTNRIIPDCATMMGKLAAEMERKKYISACSRDMKFRVNKGDAIKIKLTARPPEKFSFEDCEHSITITDELFRGDAKNVEDFLLPDECDGKINFDHFAQHLPKESEPGESITHKDRILIGADFLKQAITVGTLAMGNARVEFDMKGCNTDIHGGSQK